MIYRSCDSRSCHPWNLMDTVLNLTYSSARAGCLHSFANQICTSVPQHNAGGKSLWPQEAETSRSAAAGYSVCRHFQCHPDRLEQLGRWRHLLLDEGHDTGVSQAAGHLHSCRNLWQGTDPKIVFQTRNECWVSPIWFPIAKSRISCRINSPDFTTQAGLQNNRHSSWKRQGYWFWAAVMVCLCTF